MNRVLEAIAPARIGPSFRWLVAAGWTANSDDGLVMTAGPLLVARLAASPLLVALDATLQWLPPLVLGLGPASSPTGSIGDWSSRPRSSA